MNIALPLLAAAAAAQCVLYDTCGAMSRFGSPLPCVVNNTAPQPLQDPELRARLAGICGADFASGLVCCSESQVEQLAENLKRVGPLLGSCPACEQNFFDVFCRFTCSPHQARYVDVLRTQTTPEGATVPKEVNYFVDLQLAADTYDSCSNVKFSATNGRALDLVGGGARNYSQFFQFLGDEKPMLGGSLFQINFPWDDAQLHDGLARQNETEHWSCADGAKKCSCIDCEGACPDLHDTLPRRECRIGPLRCVSVALLLSYLAFIVGCILVWLQVKKTQRKQSALEIQRLIHDDEQGEDDPFVLPSWELGNLNLRSYPFNSWLSTYMARLASFCARFPRLVITVCVLLVLCSSLGLLGMQLETDPTKLWVAPQSREAAEKEFFDSHFGAFYRTNQLFVVNETGPVLQDYSVIEWLQSVETRIAALRTPVLMDSLDSFCLKPIGDHCVVESVTQYRVKNVPTWKRKLQRCTDEPVTCLPPFQQPIDSNLVFGTTESGSIWDSPALVTTWVLENSNSTIYLDRVKEWELLVENFLQENVTAEANERGLRLSFNVESSLERELGKSGRTDVKIVLLSYILMFAYVTLALGDSIWLGLVGIAVVVCSVVSAVGFLSLLGYKLTLVITEVIPFLALAIGVDNIFLIVHQLSLVVQVSPSSLTVVDQVAKAVGSIGPSIVLSTSCEAAALGIAAFVKMPAVHNFALFACVAVIVNSVLQLTMFVSLLTLHKDRLEKTLYDEPSGSPSLSAATTAGHLTGGRERSGAAPLLEQGSNQLNSNSASPRSQAAGHQVDGRRFSFLISTEYTPLLLGKRVKQGTVCFFVLWLAASLYVLPQISLGLDQRLAVPRDSFLVPYFSDVYDYLSVGPPAYFVVADRGIESRPMQQQICSRFSTCETTSVVNILEAERKRPEMSFLATSPASWLDDFLQWMNPDLDQCCLDPPGSQHPCFKDKPWSFNMTGFPEGKEFTRYLDKWLSQPSDFCPLAGKAPYSSAVSQDAKGRVAASHFRAMHVPLRSQQDYIEAYAGARAIADRITAETGLDVFPYSVFYPFFAQYDTIVHQSVGLIGAALAVTFGLSCLFLGSLRTSLVVTGVVASLVLNVCGLMYFFGVSLNALSLVNLVICVGLGVEFCIHIARSFTFVPRVGAIGIRGFTKVDRAFNALAGTGRSVFSGVAVTKLLGVCVLAFAHSQIFTVYYFRMWFALVISATFHSLALLPVLLSVWGGGAWLVDGEGSGFADLEEL